MLKQKEAVYQVITKVLSEHGIEFHEGMNVGPVMTKEFRAQVNMILFAGFRVGEIELGQEFDDTELKSYVSGLQSNWIRKDKRLNGATKYVAKNPGSRTGTTDAQVRALRALLASKTDPSEVEEIQGFLDKRLAELNIGKAKTAVIDYSALPADLRDKYSN